MIQKANGKHTGMREDKIIMQILEVFSDGKSHSLEAIANQLQLSYNTAFQYLRKLKAQGKLYHVGSNHRYKLGKRSSAR